MDPREKTYGPYSGKARFAQLWFRYNGIKGAPPLPTRPQDRFYMMNMKRGPLGYVTASYATSLESCGYVPFDHPDANTYACGLMACSGVPAEVRNDPEMLRRFPPKKLEGLDEETLIWHPPSDSLH